MGGGGTEAGEGTESRGGLRQERGTKVREGG